MKYPKLREIKEAVISLLTPAYTTKYPKEPHIPFENYRGKPVVDDSNCVGCETCANVCPPNAITVQDDKEKGMRTIIRDYGKCIFCGQCQEHCITGKGVTLSDKIFDLSVFDREKNIEFQEKKLIICKNCGAVLSTKEHIHFMYKKLGPKAFATVLNLNMLNERLLVDNSHDTRIDIYDELKRKDMFNILCPNCLRQVLVKYLY